ncbi:GlxA family transcriptional regulator [Microbacterium stercoris]|uniref:DJ-1/PfpI family protein n=1 Tax=Microbacterium stercoris TaxID=2820289 RepID=A0A939QG54_9MICO|nr:DJ-1/PfpI family protein [Microbacterium stercoris]MBO3662133.1 DJ-1/PfpI family protein [Microbacterium stercoris]
MIPDIARAPHRVAILVFDGVKLLDVAGPADAFSEANRLGAAYQVELVSPDGADVVTSSGIALSVRRAASEVTDAQTVLIAGGDVYPRTEVPASLSAAAASLAGRASRVASICTGAFVLAAAGALDGKRATTHWRVASTLASRHPAVTVEPDAIWIRDGSTYSSAGVTAGIDLALALIQADHGAELTRDVARLLVVYLQRAGGQSQFSVPLAGDPPRTPALRRVVEMITADPTADFSASALSTRLNVSARHLSRLFHEELATTPARYVESVRFDIARALLAQGHTATEAADLAGFPSYESLRRVFTRELRISPAAYQRRFRSALREGESSP